LKCRKEKTLATICGSVFESKQEASQKVSTTVRGRGNTIEHYNQVRREEEEGAVNSV
jgi:hypothetical protein